MGRQELTNFINLNLIEDEDNMLLIADEIFDFLKNPEYRKKYNEKYTDFMEYVYETGGTKGFGGVYGNYISIKTNPETYTPMLTCSHSGLFFDLAVMLNCLGEKFIDIHVLEKKISELTEVKTKSELIKKFPFLYRYLKVKFEEFLKPGDAYQIIREYESSKKDPIKFNILKEKYKRDGEDIEILYEKAKMCTSFKFAILNMSLYFSNILKNNKEIEKWITNNPIDIKFAQNDTKKIMLYIMESYLRTLENAIQIDAKTSAQKSLSIFESYVRKYEDNFPNDITRIEFNREPILEDYNIGISNKREKCIVTLSSLKNKCNKFLAEHPYLKSGIELPKIDTNLSFDENKKNAEKYIKDLLNNTINEDIENGAHDATEEVKNRVKQLEEEIASESISVNDKREKTIILKKIKMVLNDIKPKAVQTGTGKVFRNYYVYYYPNGMVALDRIDGYGALYIMPAHIYREARYKDNLTDVKNIPGVQRVNHKNNQWLNIAKDYIENGTDGLTEDDIKKSSEVASIDFPYTVDKLEELEKMFAEEENEIGVNETKRRIRKTKELKEIDTELKDNEFDNYNDISAEMRQKVEQLDGEKEDVLNSQDIEEMANSDKSFEELYEDWKNNHEKKKKARNPVVAAITKRRSMNENGRYCCEWCGKDYLNTSPLRSHHVRPLSQGGPDNIYNTVCICPDCHDYVHSHEITDEEQYRLFEIVRKHIEEENPEYLPAFNEMMSPIAKDDEDYMKNKAIIDRNFELQWNDVNIRKR